MTQDEAIKILGLKAVASADDINAAANQKKADLESKVSSAPTDALKAKFQQLLDKVVTAEQSLNQAGSSKASSGSRSPLSETKMADLPGMAPDAGVDSSMQTLQLGTTLAGRYEIKEQIGAGGMGAVYRASDSNTGKDLALKVLLPALMQHERARERFLDEARISQQLSHPNIVNVYDVQQDGDYYFLTMELLEGQDLRQVMDNRKLARSVFAIDEVQEIISAVSEGLAYAHKYTVHRDIKPENIWLTEQGEYKIMDFGIARVQSTSQRTQTGAAMGTAYYMAPEQLKGQSDIDGRADQYALAVLAYELLSGEVPAGMIEPIQQHRKDVPKGMAKAIHQALAPRPENRFENITEFSAAISAKGSGLNVGWALPTKSLGIAASVVGVIVLVAILGSSGALSNLGDLLPKSAEQIAAEKAASIQLQGEVETLKRRLESRRRDLKQQVRDAERNKDKDLWQLEEWQNLSENHIFESSRYGKLNGLEKLSESQIRDKTFEQAEKTLSQIKGEYERLLNLYSAAEKLPLIKQQAKQSKTKWVGYVRKGHGTADEATEAEEQYKTAQQQRSGGALVDAQSAYQQAYNGYKQLNQTAQQRQQVAEAKAQKEREVAAKAKTAAKRKAVAQAKAKRIKKLIRSLDLVKIPSGSFQMGSNTVGSTAMPVHRVNIKAFKLMSKEVTFAQYDVYAKATGKSLPDDSDGWGRGNRPVIRVNWQEAKDFAKWLSKQTGKRFRLPTEAEWEYACRSGGKDQEYCGGSSESSLAWHSENSGNKTHPVGQKQANGLGLYDMSGNIWEWTEDCWNNSYKGAPSNGSAWLGGDCSKRVLRGGSWSSKPYNMRSATRNRGTASYRSSLIYGFRLAQD